MGVPATTAPAPNPSRRLAEYLPDWADPRTDVAPVVGVLAGEGVGPEVVGAALLVLEAVADVGSQRFDIRHGDVIGTDRSAGGIHRCADFCDAIFTEGGALFCGPVGGRFVYDLRERFDLYCKLVPLQPSPAIADASILRPERLFDVDVLMVRENVGGVYFGESGRREGGKVAYQSFSYRTEQVARIIEVAARLACARRRRLAAVVKSGGVPEISEMWREVAGATAARHAIDLEMIEADNACFQLVADPSRFDVVVAPNLLGDVLADGAAVLLGSRGMSYSINLGPQGRASYQTGHGAAHDLAGSDRANPVAQILSLAAMLRESFAMTREVAWIETAVTRVLASGIRTRDIASAGSRVVGTREMAECIADEVRGFGEGEQESR